jgi:hypothetical protein
MARPQSMDGQIHLLGTALLGGMTYSETHCETASTIAGTSRLTGLLHRHYTTVDSGGTPRIQLIYHENSHYVLHSSTTKKANCAEQYIYHPRPDLGCHCRVIESYRWIKICAILCEAIMAASSGINSSTNAARHVTRPYSGFAHFLPPCCQLCR